MKRKLKPFQIFAEISRVDAEQRIVEGYAFVNEVVPGEGGVRLKRSAMEAATPDYVANGTCREIHQPSAAGKPIDVTWDTKGAYLRMKVVDDQAWKKVTEGVYRGFSVGVTPKVMRGADVTVCEWWDTSLIDRGKDKDALFTVWRSGDVDPNAEVEVEVLERASFNEYLEDCAPSALRDMALDYLWNSLYDIQWGWGAAEELTNEQKEAAIRQTLAEFTEFMVGAIATGKIPQIATDSEADVDYIQTRGAATPEITRAELANLANLHGELLVGSTTRIFTEADETEIARVATLEGEVTRANETISSLTREREEAATELLRVQGLHEAANAEIERIKGLSRRNPPVTRSYTGVERTLGPSATEDETKLVTLRTELAEISRMKPTSDENEGTKRITRIGQIKREIASLAGQ